jgi:hypothetical protein
MPLRALIDLDFLAKLANWDLLDLVQSVCGVNWAECATVESALPRARRASAKPDGRLFHSTSAASRAVAACEAMQRLPAVLAEDLALFQDQPAIDSGEAVLLAVALRRPESLVLTGDKRCLRAVAAMADLPSRLPSRVVVLETCLLKAIEQGAFERVRAGVALCPQADKAIATCFGSRFDQPPSNAMEGLASYRGELHRLWQPTLLWD